ncbi:hypothetical protein B8281_03200 [Cellulosimicrobium sp. TH-20]|nr:hypothetical protein B8281_03200 [Cellulosimicrobium sp. TH-20]
MSPVARASASGLKSIQTRSRFSSWTRPPPTGPTGTSSSRPRCASSRPREERLFPLDFAALVHKESSALAKVVHEEAIRAGANVVIDSVLSTGRAVEPGHQLERAGYLVDVVEVPYDVAAARIAQRWRDDYTLALQGDPEYRHGGRWVPEDYARSVYPEEGTRAISQESAERLAHECTNVVSFRRYWTPAGDRPRVTESDRVRHGGGLIERRAAEVPGLRARAFLFHRGGGGAAAGTLNRAAPNGRRGVGEAGPRDQLPPCCRGSGLGSSPRPARALAAFCFSEGVGSTSVQKVSTALMSNSMRACVCMRGVENLYCPPSVFRMTAPRSSP